MKHKHHDLIVAWAADTSRKVEYSANGRVWNSVPFNLPKWDESVEYRFADSVLRYRVALFYDGSVRWTNSYDNGEEGHVEKNPQFVRWLTDWTEVIETPVETPKMKKYERWLNLYDKGAAGVYATPADAETYAGLDRVECRRIEWEVPA